jgi:histone acetyltransferase (RNA polymerase elongator complex component)
VKISGSSGQLPVETDVAGKIAQYRETAGRGSLEVAFFGGSFTNLPQEVQEQLLSPLQPLMESGEVEAVRISTRPDSVDSVSAAFLKKMGVATVEVGVQSMDDDVLERSGRGYESRQVEQAVHCLKNEGLAVGAQLMPGLPGDSPAKSLDSLGSVLAMKPDFLRIYPTVVISGTLLEELYRCG